MTLWTPRIRRNLVLGTSILPLVITPAMGCSERTESPPAAAVALQHDPAETQSAPSPPALETIKDSDLRAEIQQLQRAQSKDDIVEAIENVRLTTDPAAIPFVTPYIYSSDHEVAIAAVAAVEFLAITTTDGIPVFTAALHSNVPPSVRERLVEALWEQRTEVVTDPMRVGEPLSQVLEQDSDPSVRIAAARYLGTLGEVAVIPRLQARLAAERDDSVRENIDWAIRYLRDETSEPPPDVATKAES